MSALSRTRAVRVGRLVHDVARLIAVGQPIGPAETCLICGRALTDPPSIAKGVGPACLASVLQKIKEINAKEGLVSNGSA